MATKETDKETKTDPVIPVEDRPNTSGDFSPASLGTNDPVASFGDPVSEGDEAPRKRKRRSDAGVPRGPRTGAGATRRGSKAALHEKASEGATLLYGGVGMILQGTGLAPAAGFSMVGLSDEAGPPIADWAAQRSPRFYQFLVSMSESAGIGKYVAAPIAAEASMRIERVRPALEPVVSGLHGEGSKEAFAKLNASYDDWKEEQADLARKEAERNGSVPGAMSPEDFGVGDAS